MLPLTAEELERAIVGPAQRAGTQVDPALVTTIVADVNEQPGALPLLQYALTELYERRDDDRLTLAAYRASGGVRGALATRADALYAALEPDAQRVAQQIFLRLVQSGEGTEDTRRRVAWDEVVAVAGSNRAPVAWWTLRHPSPAHPRSRSSPAGAVELAHEALITSGAPTPLDRRAAPTYANSGCWVPPWPSGCRRAKIAATY